MPESIGLGGTIIAISACLTFLSGIFLGLRLYCKLVRRRGFWWDDHVLIAAWVSFPKSLHSHMTFFVGSFVALSHTNTRLRRKSIQLIQHIGTHFIKLS